MIRFLLFPLFLFSFALYADELHEQRAVKLSEEQDELQADTATLINGQTNEKVTVLLNKCRDAMEDAIDRLEASDTGGETLAAQTDVIELIYQAAKAKTAGEGGGDGGGSGSKPGSEGMMEMMRQMLGMGNGAGGKGSKPSSGQGKGSGQGNSPGKGADGSSDAGSTPQAGLSNPHATTEERVVPKSMGGSDQEIPSEFQEALNAYNKSLQR